MLIKGYGDQERVFPERLSRRCVFDSARNLRDFPFRKTRRITEARSLGSTASDTASENNYTGNWPYESTADPE